MAVDNLIDVECVTMNGISYMIFDQIKLDGNTYLYLIEENNETNFCIRKVINENNQEYIVNLKNEDEFTKVFMAFAQKQKTTN